MILKKVPYGTFRTILVSKEEKKFTMESRYKGLLLSKFSWYLVIVKIIKIRRLEGYNYQPKNKDLKIILCKDKHYFVDAHVSIFHLFVMFFFFLLQFSSLSWKTLMVNFLLGETLTLHIWHLMVNFLCIIWVCLGEKTGLRLGTTHYRPEQHPHASLARSPIRSIFRFANL